MAQRRRYIQGSVILDSVNIEFGKSSALKRNCLMSNKFLVPAERVNLNLHSSGTSRSDAMTWTYNFIIEETHRMFHFF